MSFRYGRHHFRAPSLATISLHVDALLIYPDYGRWFASRPSLDDPRSWLADLSCCWRPWDASDSTPLFRGLSVDPAVLVWRPEGKIPQPFIPVAERRRVLSQFQHVCIYCHRAGTGNRGPDGRSWHVDHYIPHGRGGINKDFNYVLACEQCNVRKGINLWFPGGSAGRYDAHRRQGIQGTIFDSAA